MIYKDGRAYELYAEKVAADQDFNDGVPYDEAYRTLQGMLMIHLEEVIDAIECRAEIRELMEKDYSDRIFNSEDELRDARLADIQTALDGKLREQRLRLWNLRTNPRKEPRALDPEEDFPTDANGRPIRY